MGRRCSPTRRITVSRDKAEFAHDSSDGGVSQILDLFLIGLGFADLKVPAAATSAY